MNRWRLSTAFWMRSTGRRKRPAEKDDVAQPGAAAPHHGANEFAGRADLLADAECRKNTIQNIIGRSGSGERINRLQRGVELEQQHLMRDLEFCGLFRLAQRLQTFPQESLMPNVRQHAAFR